MNELIHYEYFSIFTYKTIDIDFEKKTAHSFYAIFDG